MARPTQRLTASPGTSRAALCAGGGGRGRADRPDGWLSGASRTDGRWPLLAAGLAAPVIAVGCAVAAIVLRSAPLLVVCLLSVAVWMARGQLLAYVWPAGLLLDQEGVRIGAVRWADKHPGRTHPRPTMPRQWSQEFRCPWPAVRRIGAVTDRRAIKTMIRYSYHGRKPTPLGNLATPFMRAVLVVWVESEQAVLPPSSPPGPAGGQLVQPGILSAAVGRANPPPPASAGRADGHPAARRRRRRPPARSLGRDPPRSRRRRLGILTRGPLRNPRCGQRRDSP
jgi:hypothetical protein